MTTTNTKKLVLKVSVTFYFIQVSNFTDVNLKVSSLKTAKDITNFCKFVHSLVKIDDFQVSTYRFFIDLFLPKI